MILMNGQGQVVDELHNNHDMPELLIFQPVTVPMD
jgi:hypothetical protein